MSDMPAKVSRLWSRKGYSAMTVFGHIFTSHQDTADTLNGRFGALKNHEMIHLRQAQSTGNSWFRFYVRYFWYSLCALRYFRRFRNATYYLNPFEIEAYRHMHDLRYLEQCKENGAQEWRKYARMKLSERLELVRKLNL